MSTTLTQSDIDSLWSLEEVVRHERLQVDSHRYEPFSSRILGALAKILGCEHHADPDYGFSGQLSLPGNRFSYYRETTFDLNGAGSSTIARDKHFASYFLASQNISIVESKRIYSRAICPRLGYKYDLSARYADCTRLGPNLVLKPNEGAHGNDVTVVSTHNDFCAVAEDILSRHRVILAQPCYDFLETRVLVLNDLVRIAYQKTPPTITGDGVSTIRELIAELFAAKRVAGFPVHTAVDDPRIQRYLAESKLSLDSIPPSNSVVRILLQANASSGAALQDVTHLIHDDLRALAISAARTLNLRYCAVDFLLPSRVDAPPNDALVLEVNASPGLRYYSSIGREHWRRVLFVYHDILLLLLKSSVPD